MIFRRHIPETQFFQLLYGRKGSLVKHGCFTCLLSYTRYDCWRSVYGIQNCKTIAINIFQSMCIKLQ
jgi:hypothetical protein